MFLYKYSSDIDTNNGILLYERAEADNGHPHGIHDVYSI